MNPIHIVTDKKNIASRVLLPGDPLRAKYIAENYLENVELINTVRNMLIPDQSGKSHCKEERST